MNLLTLKSLENLAEKKFEIQADEWVWAIANLEGVGYDELRPHVISLYYWPGHHCQIVFDIPQHTPIQLHFNDYSKYKEDGMSIIQLGNDELVGKCSWFAYRTNYCGSPSFHGCDNLGHALLVSRWAYEEDERAKWII